MSHLIHHRSGPFLASPLVSFLLFSLLAPISLDHLPLQHVQSSSSFCPISFLLSVLNLRQNRSQPSKEQSRDNCEESNGKPPHPLPSQETWQKNSQARTRQTKIQLLNK